MAVTTISDLRKNIAGMFDEVIDNDEVLIVTRTGHPPMVVMSLAEYESWRETEYLLAGANGVTLRRRLADPSPLEAHELIPDAELGGE